MADDNLKIYTAEVISDSPLPSQDSVSIGDAQSAANQVFGQTTIQDQPLPQRKIAHVLLSERLNTDTGKILGEFQFTQQGAIQIGKFEVGVSGDVRISPLGLLGRDITGQTTFSIDADTGNVTLKGTLLAGSVISEGVIEGGSININNKFIVDSDGNISITNQDPTVLLDARYDDLVIEVINLDLGLPGTGAGALRAYSNGIEYAYLNADEGFVLLGSKAVTITGTGTPSAPLTHQASIYVDQSGGKDRLMVRFNTGASQQLAIQP